MKKVTSNKVILFCLLFFAVNLGIKAQTLMRTPVNYVFNSDSLKGFDENAAKQGAFDVGAYGDEYKVFMYHAKREYINQKYNIIIVQPAEYRSPVNPNNTYLKGNPVNPNITVAACTNEDFEEAGLTTPIPGTFPVGTTSAVNGWTCTGGSNSGSTNTNCLYSTTLGAPNAIQVISPGTAGLTDAIIGTSYKIYSVFGTSTTNVVPAAPYDSFNHYGDWFIKLNNQSPSSSVNRIEKIISVTSANALFQYAFISVLEGAHCCCDNGSMVLKVFPMTGCSTVGSATSCPQFTASAPAGVGCSPSGTCASPGNTTTYLTSTVNTSWKYNKWKLGTLDLTSFIGQCVKIQVTAFDCAYGGHAGYTYFDSQCQAMDLVGNGTSFPAGTLNITLPTCGSGSTATITAPPVTGGYTWTAPGPYTIAPGSGGQTIYTGITGNHTLTMNPPGSCSPITRTVNVIIAPAPNLAIITSTLPSCSSGTNGVSIQMSSGTPNTTLTPSYYGISFSPAAPTGTIGIGTNTGTFTGLSVGVNTITITDSVGCIDTRTIQINAVPPIPTFSINAPNTIIGCNPSFVTFTAVPTSTDVSIVPGSVTYTWTSSLSSSVTNIYNATTVGTYTVYAQGTYTNASGTSATCTYSNLITVTGSTAIPTCSITGASTQSLTCNGACKQFTATTTSTTNLVGTWNDAGGVIVGPSGTPLVLCANAPGTYTATFCSTISGCCTSQTVAVVSNTAIPTITITPTTLNGFTINCTNPKVIMNINSSGTLAPIGYTWTPLSNPTASTTPAAGGFTATIPGQYEAAFHDGNFCTVTTTVTIFIDTLRPSPLSMTDLPSNSYTINCFTPSLVATAITNPMLSPSSYSWTTPGPLTLPSNTIGVSMGNITSSVTGVTYTVLAMGANGCVGKAKVSFYKDIYIPNYTPVATPSAITCGNPCVAMSPFSTTTTPISFTFTSPPPTQTATTSGALVCVPGTYTMTYINQLNGCGKTSTVNVAQNVIPPAVNPNPVIYLPCGQTTTIVSANTVTTSNTYSYTWEGPPGSAMSCLGGTACATSSVNMPGQYNVTIFNTQNGCTASNSVLVVAGSVNASFSANNYTGFAPLSVDFSNTSQTGSTISGSITTLWNYGNGITYTTSGTAASYSATGIPGGSTIYQSAGTYTVLLVVTQLTGTTSCVGTATAVIKVELPSKIEIPNVFTPNGDGVNDVFMLQTTNLTEIKCTIFDRWGVKMYDVTAEKGNIEWDGKNFGKKDVPAGTYFYILTAKGKDLKDYEQKGTISLYR